MDAIDAILTRRSVRNYKEDNVSDEILDKIIEAGFSAPSAGNQQPWHFIKIDDKEILKGFIKFHPHASMLKNSNKGILICGDPELETFVGYWTIDCSAATQNMLVMARALGLGGCWVGIYPKEDRIKNIRKMLKMPENVVPFSLISLGYTEEKQVKVDRFNKDRIHQNFW